MSSFVPPGPLVSPVLITAFTRLETTAKVFESVRGARPPRLYFACDGGRDEAEWEKCHKVRALLSMVDWPCEVHTLFHERNMGSKYGMAANFDWFFKHEAEGIILEDDIIPALSFFWFAEELLARYREDERVWAVIGNNLMTDGRVEDPQGYWYTAHGYGAYWGWASWRRSWERFDIDMKEWPEVRDKDLLKDFFLSRAEQKEATLIFESTWDRSLPSAWDYQFEFARIRAGAVNIIPNVNLCRNIGFGEGSTHTVNAEDPRNQDYLHEAVFPLQHPSEVAIDPERDLAYFNKYLMRPLMMRFKSWVKEIIPSPVRSFISGRGQRGTPP